MGTDDQVESPRFGDDPRDRDADGGGFERVARIVFAFVSGTVLGAGGLAFGAVLLVVTGNVLFAAGVELSSVWVIVLSLVFVQGIGCIGVTVGYLRARPHLASALGERFGWVEGVKEFELGVGVPSLREVAVIVVGYVVAIGGALVGSIVGSVIARAIEADQPTNAAAQAGIENPEVLLVLIPASVLLIGPGEELLFRGVVQGRMREAFNPWIAVVVAAVVFASLHWFALTGGDPAGNLVAVALLIGPSLVFGFSYEFTDNVVVPSLIHGLYNATLFSLLYLSIVFADEIEEMSNAALGTAF